MSARRVIDPVPELMFSEAIGVWHDWFAWFPVRDYEGRFLWLCWVRRRRMRLLAHIDDTMIEWWQHHDGRWA